jgi:hypothetical protein
MSINKSSKSKVRVDMPEVVHKTAVGVVLQHSRKNMRQYFMLNEIICSLQKIIRVQNVKKYALLKDVAHKYDLFQKLKDTKHTLMWLTPRSNTSGQ